jgi:PAS domain S-box-containing protein
MDETNKTMNKAINVLVIEDSDSDYLLVVRALRKAGYEVFDERVETAGQMQAALDKQTWNLIISDYSLPQFDAPRALALLQRMGLDIPFIVVSGTIGEDSAVAMMKAGAQDYLMKDKLSRLAPAVEREMREALTRSERRHAVAALAEERDLLRTLLEHTPDKIYFKDLQSRFTRISKSQADHLGLSSPLEALGKTDFDYFAEEHARTAYATEQHIIATGQSVVDQEEQDIWPDGHTTWESTTNTPLIDTTHQIIGSFGISRDISKRKHAEKQLQESQRFSQATIDALTAHICVLDENGTILAVNQAWHDFADANPPIPPNYCLGSNYLQVCDSAEGANSTEAAPFVEGLRAIMRGEQELFKLEYPCNNPDSEKRWFIARVTRFSGEGPLRIVVAHENITERKLSEEGLRESEERYRKLVEESHELIFTHDLELNILSINPAMVKLLGIPPNAVAGLNLYKITPVNMHEGFPAYIQAICTEGIKSGQWFFLTRGNDECILEYQSTLSEQKELIPVVRCMAQDVTDKILHERELEAIAAMSSALRSLAPDQDVVPIILNQLNQLVSMDGSAISLLDEKNGFATVALGTGAWKPWTGTTLSVDKGVFKQVSDTDQFIVTERAAYRNGSDWPGPLGDIQTVVSIPLITNNLFIGALWLGRKGKFSKGNYRLLRPISDISANAIRNAALYKETEERASTLASLYDAGLAINRVLESHAQLEILSKIAMEELHADRMVFLRYNPGYSCFKAELCLGFDKELQASISQRYYPENETQTPFDWVRVNELPLYNPNASGDPGFTLGDANVKSVLLAPVKHGQNIRGILGVMSTNTDGFTSNQERMLVLFANQAAVALENASLLSETRLQVQRLNALHNIEETINTSLDLGVTSTVLLEQIINQLNVDAADILLFNPISKSLSFSNGRGFITPALQYTDSSMGQGLAGRAAQARQMIHISDLGSQTELFADSPFMKEEHFYEYYGVPLISKGTLKGLLEIFHRSPLNPDGAWLDFMRTLAEQAAIAIDNIEMFENLQRSNKELTLAYDATIEGWSQAMDLRDKETEGHTLRVTEMTLHLSKALGLQDDALVHIRRGSLLHDIGKLGIPDRILLKPGPLDEIEMAIMKTHSDLALQMLAPIEYLNPSLDIPYCHHEKWDGSGYPRGLKGDQIPLTARIFAVVDVWDALTSNRPYRLAWTKDAAFKYLIDQAGIHFDPQIVDTFFRLFQI